MGESTSAKERCEHLEGSPTQPLGRVGERRRSGVREGERLRFPEGYRACADEVELYKESKSVFAPPDAFASGGVFCAAAIDGAIRRPI